MTTSPISSNASARCPRPPEAHAVALEWQPSRWRCLALALLGPLAALSALASGLPRPVALMLAALACIRGGVLAWRERRDTARRIRITAAGLQVDGVAVELEAVRWRGPLVTLAYRQAGRRLRLLGWPDSLDAGARRELKLAFQPPPPRRGRPRMAP